MNIEIPEYFKKEAIKTFGDAGVHWINDLPDVLALFCEKYELDKLEVVPNLSINFLCFAKSKRYGSCVLKSNGPHDGKITEIEFLQTIASQHVCKLLAFDKEHGVLLLERIEPGHELKTIKDRDVQLDISVPIVVSLPEKAQNRDHRSFPTYEKWLQDAFLAARKSGKLSDTQNNLIAAAEREFIRLKRILKSDYLIHGDLHHDNILQASADIWKCIDPQGAICFREMECARFIQNLVDLSFKTPEDLLQELAPSLNAFSKAYGVPDRTILGCVFILHVLSICWGIGMNYSDERIKNHFEECGVLLNCMEQLRRPE